MARYKKKPTKINDMPGLWDSIGYEKPQEDLMLRIVETQRQKQSTPKHVMTDEDLEQHMLSTSVRPNELEFISFGSGSSGNCSYIGIRGIGGVLIDAGVDEKKVFAELDRNYISTDKIDGIILTHDHLDHVRYMYKIVQRCKHIKIYCTPRTLIGMLRRHNISKRIKDYHKPIFKEFEFEAGPFKITPFDISHDGSDNVGFCITANDHKFVVATDMGKISERADYYIRLANHLMIESNYDEHMLTVGKYPEYLKARIRGERGHLNNEVAASYLAEIWTPALTDIFLCHLSQDNNMPEIALNCTRSYLTAKGITVGDASNSSESRQAQVQLSALPRFDASQLYIFRI